MDRPEILAEVMKILQRYAGRGSKPVAVTESTLLAEELDVDSARLVDIILDVEEKFRITIDESQFSKLKTPGDIADFVSRLMAARKPS